MKKMNNWGRGSGVGMNLFHICELNAPVLWILILMIHVMSYVVKQNQQYPPGNIAVFP